jgi:hypothetical protein
LHILQAYSAWLFPLTTDFVYGFGVENGLIGALAKAALEARVEKGKSREEIAVALGQSVDTVRRFEKAVVFLGLNDVYAAYSDVTGVSLPDLLDEAKSHLSKNG